MDTELEYKLLQISCQLDILGAQLDLDLQPLRQGQRELALLLLLERGKPKEADTLRAQIEDKLGLGDWR